MKTREQHTKIIKDHLKKHKSITTWEAIKKYKITRLSGRIFDLREAGVKIKSIWQESKGKRYVKYCLQ
jgi:hypothetical protein